MERNDGMKRFFIGLLTVFLMVSISVLGISFGIKQVCVDTISTVVVKKEIASHLNDVIYDVYGTGDGEVMGAIESSIQNSKLVDDITEKYFDEMMDSLSYDSKLIIPNTKEEIMQLISENEGVLKEHGITVTDSQKEKVINTLLQDGKIENAYEEVVTTIKKNITSEQKVMLDIYRGVTATSTKIILILLIMIVTFVIAVLKKSIYQWMFHLGLASVISGIILGILMPFGVQIVSSLLLYSRVSISVGVIVTYGYCCLGIGIVLLILYGIIKKQVN